MSTNPANLEKELLARIATGSEEAFRELFQAYRGKIYGYIYKMTESRETAEDTVHDVFLKIWESRENLMHVDNFNAYLHRMAHNRAYSGFRRLAKETLILAEIKQNLSTETGHEGEERIHNQEVKNMIQGLVNQLTPQQKQVFIMSREEGLRQEAIAEKMHISVNTVKNHLAAAMRFLREEIGKNYGPQAIALYVIHQLYSS